MGQFTLPLQQTAEIWTRPSDWVDISTVGDGEINLLVGDIANKYIAFSINTLGTNNYAVDWGDGTSGSYANGATANHSYATSSLGTPCSEGYNTWKLVISAPSDTITRLNSLASTDNGISILEVNSNATGITVMDNTFDACDNIRKINLPGTMNNAVNWTYAFRNCFNLIEITMPNNATSTQGMLGAFSGCVKLKRVNLPYNAPNLTSLYLTFNNTTTLESVRFPSSMDNVTTIRECFDTSGIKKVEFPALPACTNAYEVFRNAGRLRYISFESLPLCSDTYFAFNTIPTAEEIILPEIPKTTDIRSMFGSCGANKITLAGSMNSASNADSMFASCGNLIDLTLPATMSGVTTAQYMFNSCYQLQQINLPAMPSVTNASRMFWSPNSLHTINGLEKIGNTGSACDMGELVAFGSSIPLASDIVISCSLSEFGIPGCSRVTSVRLWYGQSSSFAGASPQVDVQGTGLSAAALEALFNDLPSGSSWTINITGAAGVGDLSAEQRQIATDKGWTITE